MNYEIVTVCSRAPQEPYYCLNEFAKSVMDEPLTILGAGRGEYVGLGDKPKLLYKAIKNGTIKSPYIIFCDCWDLVFAGSGKSIMAQYYWFESPIVISSEKNCYPTDLREEYDKLLATSSYKYLNSGMIVGETDAIVAMLEAMDLQSVPDDYWDNGHMVHINDQFLYQQIFLKQPVKITLDYNQLLCNTLCGVDASELEFGYGIKNIETGKFPCAFHFNGSAKTDGLREPILKHLQLI